MALWLKKILSAFLLPLQFGLVWIAIGIILLLIGRSKNLHHIALIGGFLVIVTFALNPVSAALLNHLQSQYPPLLHPPQNITKIVVLGSGVNDNKAYPPNLTLDSASLSRLIEGIRLFQAVQKNNPNAQLILSGGRVFGIPAVAGKMQNTAVMLGVDPKHIVIENGSQDTYQEAIYLKNLLGDAPFILVTSAYHMPRSMALFEKQAMHPIAAPTQFVSIQPIFIFWCIPSVGSLTISNIAIHEYLGMLWEKMRGYIGH